ncbi:MAG: TIGR00366 family protein [candidate division Zixibacteria bacterium]|nr:TIGR00366 family protein [candidate division Zixibacteria bacterium]
MKFLPALSGRLTRFSHRFIPSSFVIALVLTVVTFILALFLTGHGLYSLIQFWGNGFWELLSFAMQMSLIIITGYIVAVSPLVSRGLGFLARLPRGPKSSILLMVVISISLSFLHWGLSLVGSAVMVRYLAGRQKVDYYLLVAAAYLGLGCTWHAGLSGSATLLMATPGNFLEADFGLIPVSRTTFGSFNLILLSVVFLLLCFLVPNLHPAPEKTSAPVLPPEKKEKPEAETKERTWAYFLDHSPVLGILFGGLGLIWTGWYFLSHKGSLNLDVLNFMFLFLGMLLHLRPSSFWKAAQESGKLVYGVILQFPFYAGMFGIIKYSGLAQVVGDFFVRISSEKTYPLIVYWYSGLVNYFLPSGGSKWAIEAPYLLTAADNLGVPYHKVVIAYAWGDMATDLIQPFWAIPLLSVAQIDFKDIMRYLILIFAVYWAFISLVFWLIPF